MADPNENADVPEGQTDDGIWPYLGVGCLGAVAGLAAGGMIAVFVSKIVGLATGCTSDAETGAPCNWNLYWTWGARIGVILLPAVMLWRMRRGRMRKRNPDGRGTGSGSH